MATVGNILVNLSLQHADFTSGLETARSQLVSWSRYAENVQAVMLKVDLSGLREGISRAESLVAGAAATLGVGLSIGGATEMVGGVLEAAQNVQHLSSVLGIATDRLQAFHAQAFAQANVGAEEFDTTLNKMVKDLGEAEVKGGPVAEALGRIGLNAKQLAGMNVADSFTEIAQRISQIQDPLQQAITTTQIFGRAGQQLLPMFEEGAAGIEKWHREMLAAHVAMNAIDNQKLVDAGLAVKMARLQFEGMENELTVALAPAIERVANGIRGMADANAVGRATTSLLEGAEAAARYAQQHQGVILAATAGIATFTSYSKVLDVAQAGMRKLADLAALPGKWASAQSAANVKAIVETERLAQAQVKAAAAAAALATAQRDVALASQQSADLALQAAAAKQLLATADAAAAADLKVFSAGIRARAAGEAAAASAGGWAVLNSALSMGVFFGATAAIGLLVDVVGRMYAENETWSQSCYDVAHSLGVVGGAVNDVADDMERLGEAHRQLQKAQAAFAHATTPDDKLAAAQSGVEQAQAMLDAANKAAANEATANSNIPRSPVLGPHHSVRWSQERPPTHATDGAVDSAQKALKDAQEKLAAAQAIAGSVTPQANYDAAVKQSGQWVHDKLMDAKQQADYLAKLKVQLPQLQGVDALKKQSEEAQKILADLQKQVATFGGTEAQKQIYALVHGPDAAAVTPEMVAQAQALGDQIDRFKAVAEGQKEFQKIAETMEAITNATGDFTVKLDEGQSKLREMHDAAAKLAEAFARSGSWELLKDLGKATLDMAALAGKVAELQKAADGKKEADEIKRMVEDSLSPLQRFQEEKDKFDAWLKSKAIDQATYGQLLSHAKDQLDKRDEHQERHDQSGARALEFRDTTHVLAMGLEGQNHLQRLANTAEAIRSLIAGHGGNHHGPILTLPRMEPNLPAMIGNDPPSWRQQTAPLITPPTVAAPADNAPKQDGNKALELLADVVRTALGEIQWLRTDTQTIRDAVTGQFATSTSTTNQLYQVSLDGLA